ncbi:vWA domain-containing protein [Herbidospora sp. RD11066]
MLIRVALTVALVAGGCGEAAPEGLTGQAVTLRVLAGDGLADMGPVLRDAAGAIGVTVELTTTDDPARFGAADGDFDAVWPASEHLFRPGATTPLFDGTTEIMYSPVILGVKPQAARRLGWDRRPVAWADVAAAAASGRFTFGMADPARSGDGLNALVAAATALAGPGALQPGEESRTAPRLAGLFTGQTLKSNSTSRLIRAYRDAGPGGTGFPADGLVAHESEILTSNASAPPDRRLVPIYPADGVVTDDHPLSLLASAPEAKDAYQRLTAWLRTQAVQERISQLTHRRPIVGGVRVSGDLAAHQPFQIPFPADPGSVDDLVDTYNDSLRRPGTTVYVLDTSGSMKGRRLTLLKNALSALTRPDTFRRRERITFLPFASGPRPPTTFDIPETGPTARSLREIRSFLGNLTAHGGTAMYDALVRAYEIAGSEKGRIRSIVLLTDGVNKKGRDFAAFSRYHRGLPGAAPPVFTIVFGDANHAELRRVAELTGGVTFDGTSQALSPVFREIRGYQ